MAEDPTPRQLLKQLGWTQVNWEVGTAGAGFINITTTGEGWETFADPTGYGINVVNRTYIDLAGYTQDELTTFVQNVAIQNARAVQDAGGVGTSFSNVIHQFDFITTRRLNDSEVSNLVMIAAVPGYLGSTVDLMEMVYGEHRTFSRNTSIPNQFVITFSDTLGSGNPSAADRLHWTRIFWMQPGGAEGDNGIALIYPANLVCQAITAKESDLVYIERLRRSYTQQRSET
jgi:hypothetical protein